MVKKITVLLWLFYNSNKGFISIEFIQFHKHRFFEIPLSFKKKNNAIFINNSKCFKIRYAKRKRMQRWTKCKDIAPRQLYIKHDKKN